MTLIGLAASTTFLIVLAWLWVLDWRAGSINRFPTGIVYRDKEPGRFKFWTAIDGVAALILLAFLMFGWWALFTGNLK